MPVGDLEEALELFRAEEESRRATRHIVMLKRKYGMEVGDHADIVGEEDYTCWRIRLRTDSLVAVEKIDEGVAYKVVLGPAPETQAAADRLQVGTNRAAVALTRGQILEQRMMLELQPVQASVSRLDEVVKRDKHLGWNEKAVLALKRLVQPLATVLGKASTIIQRERAKTLLAMKHHLVTPVADLVVGPPNNAPADGRVAGRFDCCSFRGKVRGEDAKGKVPLQR